MPADPPVEIAGYLARLDHPLAPVALLLRECVLEAVPGAVESIKWKAPNFALEDDFATFNLRRPTAVQVILHTGAKPKPEHPEIVIDDAGSMLKWADHNRAIATFASEAEARAQAGAFTEIVRSWVGQLAS